jgi:hypothetical protein
MKNLWNSIQLFWNGLRFMGRYKRVLFFPLGVLLSYACLFGCVLSALYIFIGPLKPFLDLHPLFFIRGYYWIGLLIYSGCCAMLLTFFNLGLMIYFMGCLRNEPLTVLGALNRAIRKWRYVLWNVWIGNVLFFIFSMIRFFSEPSWIFLAKHLGRLERAMGFFLLPVGALENLYAMRAVRRSSSLLRQHQTEESYLNKEPINITWIYFGALLSVLTMLLIFSAHLDGVTERVWLASIGAVILLMINLFCMAITIIFQTIAYGYVTGIPMNRSFISAFQLELVRRAVPKSEGAIPTVKRINV